MTLRRALMICLMTAVSAGSQWSLAAESPSYPIAVVAAADGVLYVADLKLPGIWKVQDGKRGIHVQASEKFRTPLNRIRCLALDQDGALLAGDSATREVYRVAADGGLTPLTKGGIGIPMCIAVSAQGEIFVSDLELQRVWKVPPQGGEPQEFAVVAAVRGLAFDNQGVLWAARGDEPGIVKFGADGTIEPVLTSCPFEFTNQLAIGGDNTLYVADGYAKSIWKVTPAGAAEKWITGDPLVHPVGLGWRGTELLIADPRATAVFAVQGDQSLRPVVEATGRGD